MKTFFSILWAFFLFLAISFIVKLALFPVFVWSKIVNTAYESVDKTVTADNAIYNYEWFKQKYEEIQASKIQIDNTKILLDSFKEWLWERKDWSFEDKIEYDRLNTVYLWQKNYLENLIADYNARSKMANRAIFKDSIIPSFIDVVTFWLK